MGQHEACTSRKLHDPWDGFTRDVFDGCYDLRRCEIMYHMSGASDYLQLAAPDVRLEPPGSTLEHDLVAVSSDDGDWQLQVLVVPL